MHSCELNLMVHGEEDTSILLSRQLNLPFAPFPGVYLVGLARCDGWNEHPGLLVTLASYDPARHRWVLELQDINEDAPMCEILDDLGPKWQLHEQTRAVEAEAPF